MSPRQPRKTSKDARQDKNLQGVPDALNETATMTAPAGAPSLQSLAEIQALETDVELDRNEQYLRGPTAFTA